MEKQKEPKKAGFLTRMFNDLYEVNLYMQNEEGEPVTKTYMMSNIRKLNNTILRGTDSDGIKIEFNSTKPFDYEKRKLY